MSSFISQLGVVGDNGSTSARGGVSSTSGPSASNRAGTTSGATGGCITTQEDSEEKKICPDRVCTAANERRGLCRAGQIYRAQRHD